MVRLDHVLTFKWNLQRCRGRYWGCELRELLWDVGIGYEMYVLKADLGLGLALAPFVHKGALQVIKKRDERLQSPITNP